jgi:archaellum component FlaC
MDNQKKKKNVPHGTSNKPIKSIDDLVNEQKDDIGFDPEDISIMEETVKKSHEKVESIKKQFEVIKTLPDEEFSKTMLKQLIERASTMLAALESEIIDNPSGRAIETAATMVTAINNIVDCFNKMNTTKEKLELEKQKMISKHKNPTTQLPHTISNTNNILVADNSSILDMLANNGIVPGLFKEHQKNIEPKKE